MGPPLSERPPVPTEAERLAAKEADRATRDLKQAARGRKVAIERTIERRKLAEKTRLILQVEEARIRREAMKKKEAQLNQRRQAAEMLVRYEMLDKNILQSFADRLSSSLEQQIPAKGVPLELHLQEAKTSLDQARLFSSSIQEQLNTSKKETGSVVEKPQEQIRLETVLPAIDLMITEAEAKLQRLESYTEQIQGREQELREADARLLQNAQGITQPEDFAWVNFAKELGLTESERKAARFGLYNTGKTKTAIRQQNASQKAAPKDDKTEGIQASTTPHIPEQGQKLEVPPKDKDTSQKDEDNTEKSDKKGGIFGWFGR
jgi:hypothetical protein